MSNPYAAISRGDDGGNSDSKLDAPGPHPMMDRLSDVMYYSGEPNLPDSQENPDTFLKWLGDLLTGGGR